MYMFLPLVAKSHPVWDVSACIIIDVFFLIAHWSPLAFPMPWICYHSLPRRHYGMYHSFQSSPPHERRFLIKFCLLVYGNKSTLNKI